MPRSRAIPFLLPNVIAASMALVAALAISLTLLRAADAAPLTDPAEFVRDFGERVIATAARSEERRVGKECTAPWSPYP